MTKYATIDMHSGYVWWVGEANNAEDACRKSDIECGNTPAAEYTSAHRNDASYAVHTVPDFFDVSDGQDSEEIKATQLYWLEGFYRRVEA